MAFATVHEPISLTNVERSLYGIGADRDVAGTPAVFSLPLIGAACAARTFSLRHKPFKMTVEAFSNLSDSNED